MRLLAVAVLLQAGCFSKTALPGEGTLKDGVYSNAFFAFSLDLPPGWEAEKAPPTLDRFVDNYMPVLAAAKNQGPRPRVHNLLKASSAPIPLMGTRDAAIVLGAAYVGDKPGFDAARALVIARKFLLDPASSLRLAKDFTKDSLGGYSFARADFFLKLKDGALHESVFVATRNGYVLVMAVSARDPRGLELGQTVLRSLRWN